MGIPTRRLTVIQLTPRLLELLSWVQVAARDRPLQGFLRIFTSLKVGENLSDACILHLTNGDRLRW